GRRHFGKGDRRGRTERRSGENRGGTMKGRENGRMVRGNRARDGSRRIVRGNGRACAPRARFSYDFFGGEDISDRRTFAEMNGGIAISGLATAAVGTSMLADDD